MAQPNRETVRDQLATLLEATLVTNDEIVQAVYNYRISDFEGIAPVSSSQARAATVSKPARCPSRA